MSIHTSDLAQLVAPYAHIFLAPHLDDAALSCGGLIAQLTSQDEAVLVVNLCSGSPPPDAGLSGFAAAMHERWALPDHEVVRLRRAEDAAALDLLAADSYHLAWLDAIYRMPDSYATNEQLFGPVVPTDPLVRQVAPQLANLAARFPSATFYAPLGVGHHVDHQIAHRAAHALAHQGCALAYYEDFPYVATAGALLQRLNALGDEVAFQPVVQSIDATLPRKLAAIAAYRSQIGMLFGDCATMETTVKNYAAGLARPGSSYAERLWIPQ
ncbi:PIG-L deacetylase family protein [Candidatus Viridilinea mediisalina]|uniref:GlcNAc-PI de-N-acetylase n=1 Tax=Candidatus Viridilinea mediisalina TaxID=2024553 RepID=A0A2A6RJY4_9CHLR|nr:PIG-L family deacetylase [Candidatus Viridilinea mediisalina]PDW03377.1 hypothetical protein CJ255_08965 [Candidatus Viridilinea mediisalina]